MKKFALFALTVLLAGCGSTASAAASASAAGASAAAETTSTAAETTAAAELTAAADGSNMVVKIAGMHIYDQASLDGNIIAQTTEKEVLDVIDVTQDGVTRWFHVKTSDGTEGYLYVTSDDTIIYNGN